MYCYKIGLSVIRYGAAAGRGKRRKEEKKKSGRTQTFRLASSNLKLRVPIVHIAVCVYR